MTLADVLARLEGVRPCAGGHVARCPAHDDRNASLSIHEVEDGRVLFNCFAGCSFEAIRDALGLSWRPGLGSPRRRSGANAQNDAERQRRVQEYALGIWRETRPAAGTLVETYLKSRWISIPIPLSLRFHPNLKHPSGVFLPAMVAAVQAVDSRIVALHRTFLKSDGSGKANVEP